MKNLRILSILFIGFFFTQCQPKTQSVPKLGSTDIEVTGSEEAMPFFKNGYLLLHSFEYEDAAEQFIKAQETDPDFVMAYWGEAMTKNHPLWKQQYTEEGMAALEKLAPTPEERATKTKTQFEKDMMKAVEILFAEGDKKEKDVQYRDYMKQLYEKYPKNLEVASFYALSLLGAVKSGRDTEAYEKGAIIAKGVIQENPNHPGALHYLIHSYDDPDHAKMALSAANSYSKVAPDAAHALHMPSHIYVAMGMWDEVISSNDASYNASVARKKRKNLTNDALGYHSFKWWMYGLLQKGEYEKAKEMVLEIQKNCEAKPSHRARNHLIQMKSAYTVESLDWDENLLADTTEFYDLNISTRSMQAFVNGMKFFKKNEKENLSAVINEMKNEIIPAENAMVTGGVKMCSGISAYQQPPDKTDVNQSKVMLLELKALAASMDGDDKEADRLFAHAVELERSSTFTYGPPEIVKPAPELYGEWLLEKGKYEDAKVQFEKALERAPGRRLAVMGAQAAEKMFAQK